jgi:hypothetical protein
VVLFLDEFTEFRRDAVESLSQPLEDSCVVVARIVGALLWAAGVLARSPSGFCRRESTTTGTDQGHALYSR